VELKSSQPYLLRAIYEWIIDNDLTPYLLVDASNDDVFVPHKYVDNGKIVLNIAPRAVDNLELSNEHVLFDARFTAVLAIYAKENGQGMVFNETPGGDEPPPEQGPSKPRKPSLKVVK
jgi:stringent starvation protein B